MRKLLKSKSGLVLFAAAGAFSFHVYAHDNLKIPMDSGGSIGLAVDAFVRSSRAISTVGAAILDYKYSLHGMSRVSDEYKRELSEVHMRSARKILRLCEANKGFYVKAGQFVAALGQAPKEYVSTLSSLQDKAVPCDFVAIKEVLVSNFGPNLSEIFHSFDEQPIAAASIAQVHHAVLKNHQEVAVKVQYPGLERQRKLDLMTMRFLSHCVTWLFPEYRFVSLVVEFSKAVSLELDFIQEARNSERTAKSISKDVIKVPKVFWEMTTTQVLTMEFCKGQRVDNVVFLKKNGIDPAKVAKALAEVFAEMIFVHGFVHGDPHPGNILVSPTSRGGFKIVLLDHGVYKQLDDEFRRNYCQLWKALILQDSQKIQQLGEQFGVGIYSRYFPIIFTGRTVDSKSTLGKGMSLEERKELKEDLKSLRMEDISSFLESLSPDFLMILRVDGLLRSLNRKLGAPQRTRLLTYSKYALYGLSARPEGGHDSGMWLLSSTFSPSIAYFRLRLYLEVYELLSQLRRLGQFPVAWLKHFLSFIRHSLGGVYSALV